MKKKGPDGSAWEENAVSEEARGGKVAIVGDLPCMLGRRIRCAPLDQRRIQLQMKMKVAMVSAMALAVVLSACAVPGTPYPTQSDAILVTPALLAGTEWTAFAVDGLDEVVNPKPKLRWDLSSRVSGTGGCNAFGGPSVVAGGSLRMGPLAAIGKMCMTLPGGQEDLFFKALERTRKARLEQENQLVLLDDTGKPLARFFKAN